MITNEENIFTKLSIISLTLGLVITSTTASAKEAPIKYGNGAPHAARITDSGSISFPAANTTSSHSGVKGPSWLKTITETRTGNEVIVFEDSSSSSKLVPSSSQTLKRVRKL